jgi:acyl carrier protein
VRERVFDVIRAELALRDDDALSEELTFAELGADELDLVEIGLALEWVFGIAEIPDAVSSAKGFGGIATVADLVALVERFA